MIGGSISDRGKKFFSSFGRGGGCVCGGASSLLFSGYWVSFPVAKVFCVWSWPFTSSPVLRLTMGGAMPVPSLYINLIC